MRYDETRIRPKTGPKHNDILSHLRHTIENAPGFPSYDGSFERVDADADLVSRLSVYVDELQVGNRRFGLVVKEDAADRDRLFLRHIADSLSAWRVIAQLVSDSGRTRLYDLGSGAGLPGIPLALLFRARFVSGSLDRLDEVILVERKAKRVAFLRGAVPLIVSANARDIRPQIRIIEQDADQLQTKEGSRLDDAIVVFRAYQQTTPEFLKSLSVVFPPGTPICALKGRYDQAQSELETVRTSPDVRSPGSPSAGITRTISFETPAVIRIPGAENDPDDAPERCLLVWMTDRADTR